MTDTSDPGPGRLERDPPLLDPSKFDAVSDPDKPPAFAHPNSPHLFTAAEVDACMSRWNALHAVEQRPRSSGPPDQGRPPAGHRAKGVAGNPSGAGRSSAHLQAGRLLRQYRILDVLGAGGFGVTYLARDEGLDKLCAVKECFPDDVAQRKGARITAKPSHADDFAWAKNRLTEEAKIIAGFRHPNIVEVIQVFEENNTAYVVEEYERGRSLKVWLAEIGRAPTQAELDRLIEPLLDALELVHRNELLHRDIAPDNIIIRDDGNPVLIDFGSARRAIEQRTKAVSALVKPGYSPHEQYSTRGRRQGPWTDIYAFGATLYHAVTGTPPEEATDRFPSDTHVSAHQSAAGTYRAGFLAAIDWALRFAPGERPQSIGEWRAALFHQGEAAAVSSRPAPPQRSITGAADTPVFRPAEQGRASGVPWFSRAWRGAILSGLGAVLSALLSADVSLVGVLQVSVLSDIGVLLPGAYFGLVVCIGVHVWSNRSLFAAMFLLATAVLAWIVAYGGAFWTVRYLIVERPGLEGLGNHQAFELGGLLGGFSGSLIIAIAVAVVVPGFRTPRNVARTVAAGTVFGLLLDDHFVAADNAFLQNNALLYLAWQPAVAASIAYGLAKLARDEPTVDPDLDWRALAAPRYVLLYAGVVAALLAHGLYQDQRSQETAAYVAVGTDMAKLRQYLATCVLCERKMQVSTEIKRQETDAQAQQAQADAEQRQFEAARSDRDKLESYMTGCIVCAFKSQAQEQIAAIDHDQLQAAEQAQYGNASAHGDIDGLRGYALTCSLCEHKSVALQEIARLQAPVPVAPSAPPAAAVPPRPPPPTGFSIVNNTGDTLNLAFYDGGNRQQIDPVGNGVYVQNGNSTRTYLVNCTPGRNVCYGAAVQGSALNSFWGVGYGGKQSCAGCCLMCQGGTLTTTLNTSDARRPQPTVTWKIIDGTSRRLSVAFYSQTRAQWAWPGWSQNWTVVNRENSYTLDCAAGEKICYGAWPVGEIDGPYWGVGPYSRYGCTNCCSSCDGGTYTGALGD
jgi:serine/threonine protein kinase